MVFSSTREPQLKMVLLPRCTPRNLRDETRRSSDCTPLEVRKRFEQQALGTRLCCSNLFRTPSGLQSLPQRFWSLARHGRMVERHVRPLQGPRSKIRLQRSTMSLFNDKIRMSPSTFDHCWAGGQNAASDVRTSQDLLPQGSTMRPWTFDYVILAHPTKAHFTSQRHLRPRTPTFDHLTMLRSTVKWSSHAGTGPRSRGHCGWVPNPGCLPFVPPTDRVLDCWRVPIIVNVFTYSRLFFEVSRNYLP